MSQEKMDRYKAAKANKKEIRKKQKRTKIFTILAWILIPLAIIGLLVWGAYALNHPKDTSNSYSSILDPEASQDYESNINETSVNDEDFKESMEEPTVEETNETAATETVATEEESEESTDTVEESIEETDDSAVAE